MYGRTVMFLIVEVDDKYYEKKYSELERAYEDAQVAAGPSDEEVLVAMIADDMADKGSEYDQRQAGMSVYHIEDWESTTEAHTSLHDACACGDIGPARMLLKTGADVNIKRGRNAGMWQADETPLHVACQGYLWGPQPRPEDALAVIRLLLETGADPMASGVSVIDLALKRWQDSPKMKTSILGLFREHDPEATLESVLKLPFEDPLRERTLDWYREHRPELVMERYCSSGPQP